MFTIKDNGHRLHTTCWLKRDIPATLIQSINMGIDHYDHSDIFPLPNEVRRRHGLRDPHCLDANPDPCQFCEESNAYWTVYEERVSPYVRHYVCRQCLKQQLAYQDHGIVSIHINGTHHPYWDAALWLWIDKTSMPPSYIIDLQEEQRQLRQMPPTRTVSHQRRSRSSDATSSDSDMPHRRRLRITSGIDYLQRGER